MGYGKKIAHYIKPMLATAIDQPFTDKDWLFELKLDGYRAIAEISKKEVLLYSRGGLSLAPVYPPIPEALKKIKTEAVFDGEIVLLNKAGKPDFQKLQNYEENRQYELVYYVFDLLSREGKDLTGEPLTERKKQLEKMLDSTGPVRYCSHIETRGEDFFKAVKKDKLEGIMAKKKDSRYKPGVRTRDWLKIKNQQSQEAVIVGFTAPKGSRHYFGSILLAQYRNKDLIYVGHAGTGFSEEVLAGLMKKMKPLETGRSPLSVPVKAPASVTWIRPRLVCEVGYSEITEDGILRHPVYKGLRPDKKPPAVQQESERGTTAQDAVGASKSKNRSSRKKQTKHHSIKKP